MSFRVHTSNDPPLGVLRALVKSFFRQMPGRSAFHLKFLFVMRSCRIMPENARVAWNSSITWIGRGPTEGHKMPIILFRDFARSFYFFPICRRIE